MFSIVQNGEAQISTDNLNGIYQKSLASEIAENAGAGFVDSLDAYLQTKQIAEAQTQPKRVYVKGYYRKEETYSLSDCARWQPLQ